MRLSDHEQRLLDQASGVELDRVAEMGKVARALSAGIEAARSERKLSYDPKCEDLARHFAERYGAAEISDLAQDIQDAVEAWFESHNENNR